MQGGSPFSPLDPGISQGSLSCQAGLELHLQWVLEDAALSPLQLGCTPQHPGTPTYTVPLAVPLSQLSPRGLAGQGAWLSLPGATQHTRLQKHWSLLHREAFSGVPINTGTISRARATSSVSCFPNKQTPLEIEPGTGAGPTAPNCSETAAGSHLGAKALLRLSHCLRAGGQSHRGSASQRRASLLETESARD